MEKNCKLSIIIPMYNVGKYIDRCLSSCYHQDIDEIQYEVIVIDDGSTDDGYEKVMNWKMLHENLQCIHQENQGQSIARNHGMTFARGEYVWFLDADDEVEQNCLSYLLILSDWFVHLSWWVIVSQCPFSFPWFSSEEREIHSCPYSYEHLLQNLFSYCDT